MGTFAPPTIPWLEAQPLQLEAVDLGLGLEGFDLAGSLERLCALPELQAVIAKEPQLTPEAKLQLWKHCRQAVGSVPVGCDLVVQGSADAARLSQSRWHVMGV